MVVPDTSERHLRAEYGSVGIRSKQAMVNGEWLVAWMAGWSGVVLYIGRFWDKQSSERRRL